LFIFNDEKTCPKPKEIRVEGDPGNMKGQAERRFVIGLVSSVPES
jgi:hypothetical protein